MVLMAEWLLEYSNRKDVGRRNI